MDGKQSVKSQTEGALVKFSFLKVFERFSFALVLFFIKCCNESTFHTSFSRLRDLVKSLGDSLYLKLLTVRY